MSAIRGGDFVGYTMTEGQLNELMTWCDYEGMEVVAVYEERGKSGKSIEGSDKIEGRTIKSIEFNFAIPKGVANEQGISLEKKKRVETVVLMSRKDK